MTEWSEGWREGKFSSPTQISRSRGILLVTQASASIWELLPTMFFSRLSCLPLTRCSDNGGGQAVLTVAERERAVVEKDMSSLSKQSAGSRCAGFLMRIATRRPRIYVPCAPRRKAIAFKGMSLVNERRLVVESIEDCLRRLHVRRGKSDTAAEIY